MARPRKQQRASEGKRTLKTVNRNGKTYTYYEFSFVTPLWAFDKWPDLRLPARTTKTFPLSGKLDGEAWLLGSLQAVHSGTWEPDKLRNARERRETTTFRQFAVPWVEHRKKSDGTDLKETAKQKYRESLDLYLLPFFGDMPMTSITPKDVQRWYDGFRPVQRDADLENRRAHVYHHLATMMKSAAEEPLDNEGHTLIPSSPCRLRVGKPAVKHVAVRPTREQLDQLLDALPEWVWLVAFICDGAALRESEALGLRRRHIDLKNLKITVDEQVQRVKDPKTGRYETVVTTPKTKSSRDNVPMTQELADRIADWMDSKGITDPEAPLFLSPRTGKRLYAQNYRNAFADARRRVPGLESMRPHDLRRDCLSRMVERGATITEVMRQGRHTSLDVASRYQVTSEQHLSEVMERMNQYDKGSSARAAKSERTGGVPTNNIDIGGIPTKTGSPRNEPASDTPDDTRGEAVGELMALADVLAGMGVSERVAVLRPLPLERRVKVLELLPTPVKVETMTELLRDAG